MHSVEARLAELAADCGYSEDEDCGVDALIDYKNALEELVYELLAPYVTSPKND